MSILNTTLKSGDRIETKTGKLAIVDSGVRETVDTILDENGKFVRYQPNGGFVVWVRKNKDGKKWGASRIVNLNDIVSVNEVLVSELAQKVDASVVGFELRSEKATISAQSRLF